MVQLATILPFLIWASIYGARSDRSCDNPLGMESGAILDSQVSATTWAVLEEPQYARLNKRGGEGGWTPSTHDQSQYLSIDLGAVATITEVATQGRYGYDDNYYVTSYKLLYSTNGRDWTTFSEDGGSDKTFQGNSDLNRNELSKKIDARYVRFNPLLFMGAPTMRVELYGCLKDTGYFDGDAYIKYDVSRSDKNIAAYEDLIQFYFRSSLPDGVIVAGVGTQSDYLFIQLKEGKIHLNINLGDSPNMPGSSDTFLEGGSLLDDDHWHFVEYKRQGRMVELSVDGVTVAMETNGLFTRLNLDTEITIGAALMQRGGLDLAGNFIGCLKGILISNSVNPDKLGTALRFVEGVRDGRYNTLTLVGQLRYDDCGGQTLSPVTFSTAESYLRWPGPNLSQNFTVSLKFRTFSRNGLFVNNQLISSGGGQFISLGLMDGTPAVEFNTGSEKAITLYGVGSNLNDGKWHSIRFEMASNVIRWKLDKVTSVTQWPFSFTTGRFYYIGGANDISAPIVGNFLAFRGCLGDVQLGDNKIDFRAILTSPMPSGARSEEIEVDACSLEDWCTPHPCANGGQCQSNWDTFTCDCASTGYLGATCSISEHRLSCESVGSRSIDPDGSGPLPAVQVDCEAVVPSADGTIFTVIGHDVTSAEDVPAGSVEPGSFSRDVAYTASPDQVRAVIDNAEYCEQYVKYECNNAKLLNSPNGNPYGWWISHNDQKMAYWGGSAPGTGKCACGLFETCYDRRKWCNCDAEEAPNKVDEGLLRHKQFLPVKQLRFGDVPVSGSSAKYTLGPLKCRGKAFKNDVVTFRSRESHLAYPIGLGDTKALVVSLEFKTTQDAAILFTAEGSQGVFVTLELYSHKAVRFIFNYGAGVKEVTQELSAPINDNEWHHVLASIDTKEATLTVDTSGMKITTYNMGKLRLRLLGNYFIGTSTLQTNGFVGCMRALRINGRLMDMVGASKTARRVGAGCSGKCDQAPCLNGGQCFETYDEIECQCDATAFKGQYCSREIGSRMASLSKLSYDIPSIDVKDSETDVITVAFTTDTPRGVLLRIENSNSDSFEELALANPQGHLTFTYRLGSGAPITLVSEHNYADSKHHFVEVTRDGNEAKLKVDDYSPLTKLTPGVDTTFQGANKLILGSQDSSSTFQGCISRVRFNDVFPLKGYYSEPRPDYVTGSGTMEESRCNVEEEIPKLAVPDEPMPQTPPPPGDTEPSREPQVRQSLAAGDKAAITFVILVLLLALILLIVLIMRYKHQHKGMYHTNEAKGADGAGDADTAVMMTGHGQMKPDKKKEWYI